MPRFRVAPARRGETGQDVIDLAAAYGLDLLDWQREALLDLCSETRAGRWATPRAGLSAPRQNGKGALFEARELAGLLLFDEQLLIHSAHEYKTAVEHFRRIRGYFDAFDDLRRRVRRVSTSTAREYIEMRDGKVLRFMARSKQSGRGFSADFLGLDEAQELSEDTWAAILPTVSARPNPAIWLMGTPPSERMNGEVWTRVRASALAGEDARLAYLEYSADPADDPGEPATWQAANPSMPTLIAEAAVRDELHSMDESTFARERLGQWAEVGGGQVIPDDSWQALACERDPTGRVAFAIDVNPDRGRASIGVAGYLDDGRLHVQVIDNRKGVGWVVPRLKELTGRWAHVAVVVDSAGPAASLLPALRRERVRRVKVLSAREVASACGAFYDAAMSETLAHPDTPVLNEALAVARKRPLGDAWAWHRRGATADITPLVAVTFASFGLASSRQAATSTPAGRPKALVL